MEFIEISAKNLSEAITDACTKLCVTSDRLYYEVVEEGSTGLFGFGSKPTVIKACIKEENTVETITSEEKTNVSEKVVESVKEVKEVKVENPAPKKEVAVSSVSAETYEKKAEVFLTDVFQAMNMDVKIYASYNSADNSMDIDLSGDEMGLLIGKRGQTLDSLQYLVSLVVNKDSSDYIRVKVDTENYRERRKETLENLAKNISYKVKRTKRPFALEPMNPYERRIIHSALQDDKYVTTHSEGDEPFRRVVVTLKR